MFSFLSSMFLMNVWVESTLPCVISLHFWEDCICLNSVVKLHQLVSRPSIPCPWILGYRHSKVNDYLHIWKCFYKKVPLGPGVVLQSPSALCGNRGIFISDTVFILIMFLKVPLKACAILSSFWNAWCLRGSAITGDSNECRGAVWGWLRFLILKCSIL